MPRCCWEIQGEEERKLKENEKTEKKQRKEEEKKRKREEKKRKKELTHATPERSWRKRKSLRSWWRNSHNTSTKIHQQSTDGQKERSLPSPVPQRFEETHEGSFNSAEGDVMTDAEDVDACVALPDEQPPRVWLLLDEQYREYLAPLCARLERCVQSEMDIAVHVCTAMDDDARATSDLGIRVKVMTSMYADVPDNILHDAFPGFNHSILLIVYRSNETSQFATNFQLDQVRSGISIAHDDSYVKCFLQIVVQYIDGTPHDYEVNSHYWRELQYIVNVYNEMLAP